MPKEVEDANMVELAAMKMHSSGLDVKHFSLLLKSSSNGLTGIPFPLRTLRMQ